MPFTKIGTVVALILVALGGLTLILGLLGMIYPPEFVDPTRPGPRMPPGKAVDLGARMAFAGIVLGVLCEISAGVRQRHKESGQATDET
ncbi:hypothetical protein [Boseongicola aestuarii]|uniref:Uncharacterized protein n=1 Tax=Boseongicola aestuarii TaxID=1470561 RepID=A0A238IZY1_9RHOB|nr:hypothetical protein [Boseongicola aestuarii]SMX24028.1 hypothetical protein BOA8489_02143 [Boseongicola aestuarii]